MSTPMCGGPMKEEKINGFERYEVEGWLSTVTRARELKADAKKMKAVQKLAAMQVEAAKQKQEQASLEAATTKRLSKLGKK